VGVEANATERAIRGETRETKKDGIYRASLRGASTHMSERTKSVAQELAGGGVPHEFRSDKLVQTRREVEKGWKAVSAILMNEGRAELTTSVHRFLRQMPMPQTEQELIAEKLLGRTVAERSSARPTDRSL
jgi:hypothetical protein